MESPFHYYGAVYVARIALTSDQEYRNKYPSDWPFQMEANLNNVEGIYARNVGIEFRIVLENAANLFSTNALDLREEYRLFMESDPIAVNTARNIGHLFTGKDLIYPVCDGALGIGYQGSLAVAQTPMNPAYWAYSVSMTLTYFPFQCWDATPFERMIIAAHEMGHVFDARHEYAVEDPPGSFKWTIMGAPFPLSNTREYFSDGTLDAGKNNLFWMRQRTAQRITDTFSNNVAASRNGGSAASSCGSPYGERQPPHTIDEQLNTYWWAGTLTCTLTVTFASTFRLTKFVIREFASSYLITSFTVDVLTPEGSWVQVHADTSATHVTYVGSIKIVDATAIRLNVLSVCCGQNAVIREFEAYTGANLALQANGGYADASGSLWGHTPDEANDGDFATYWWAPATPSELNVYFDRYGAGGANPRPYWVTQLVVRAFASTYGLVQYEIWVLGSDDIWRQHYDGCCSPVVTIYFVEGYVPSSLWIKGIRLKVTAPTCCGGLNAYAVIREFEAYGDNSEPASDHSLRVYFES